MKLPPRLMLTTFAAAFNARDIDAMAALLTPDATAQVVGAPFPEECGADKIRVTSFPYLCDARLTASVVEIEGTEWVLLRNDAGEIDTALDVRRDGDLVTRIEYIVAPHRPERLRALGAACGLPTVSA